ncbi:hypothetical protein [Paenibacillus wulumuqiensis]|uniref:hypothetical protein n=1 Tax=Paenibacillus wulumuqiensis TaxID=1567107 RepID=UPI00061967A5|nr:hypothetical protein [Paenibacillus wulumuqiensis]
MRNQHVLKENWNEKSHEVKTFFHKLATDPTLQPTQTSNTSEPLMDWLSLARYPLNHEITYYHGIYEDKTYRPLPDNGKQSINVALLLDMIFQNMGMKCSVNDLMEHINSGGTLEGFIAAQGNQSL